MSTSHGPKGPERFDTAEPSFNACEQLVKSYSPIEARAVARALDGAEREQGYLRPEALMQRRLLRRIHGV